MIKLTRKILAEKKGKISFCLGNLKVKFLQMDCKLIAVLQIA